MTAKTWMSKKSRDSQQRAKRQKCVSTVYRSQTGSGVTLNDIDVSATVHITDNDM